MKFNAVIYTDPGTRKKVNQDSSSVQVAQTSRGEALLAVVCDGVGGLKSGEQASATVVKKLSDWFETRFPLLIERDTAMLNIKDELVGIINDISSSLKIYGRERGINLGTTLALFLSFSGKGLIVNVGDSRIYCLRNNSAYRLSRDQTVAQRDIESGRLSPEKALADKRSHVLLQCIGASETVTPDFSVVNVEKNDSFVICTDGFYRKTTENELVFNAGSSASSTEDSMEQGLMLIADMVKNRGETDNITAVSVKAL